MAEGLIVEVTHAGLTPDSILLSDVDVSSRFDSYRGPGPVYVPVGGSIQLVYTMSVAISFESGAIRSFINSGHVTAQMISGDAVEAAIFGTPTDTLDVYLDGVNGDDANDGLATGAPVKTWGRATELLPRPIMDQIVTVNFIAGYDCDVNGQIDLSGLTSIGGGHLILRGATTLVRSSTLTDGDPLGDQWAVEDNVGGFTAADVGRVFVPTSGIYAPYGDWMVCELVDASTVRLDMTDGIPSYWTAGDGYDIRNITHAITATTATAIENAPIAQNLGALNVPGPHLKIRLYELEIQGGIVLSNTILEIDRCLIREGEDMWGTSIACAVYDSSVVVEGSAAIRGVAVAATNNGWDFRRCEFRNFRFDGTATYNTSLASNNWSGRGVYLESCSGEITAVTMSDTALFQMMGCHVFSVGYFAANGVEVAVSECQEYTQLYRIIAINSPITVSGGELYLRPWYTSLPGLFDGQNTLVTAIKVTKCATLKTQGYSTADTFLVKDCTGPGVVVDLGSSIQYRYDITVDNCGVGFDMEGARISGYSGALQARNCTGDGANLRNCTGSAKFDCDDNGGWGLQALKASQIYDLGSTFAGNVSGASNTDASSNFVA